MATVRIVTPAGGTVEIENGDADNVGAILARVNKELGLTAGLQAQVNGAPATATTPVRPGDEVAFGKKVGQKGFALHATVFVS